MSLRGNCFFFFHNWNKWETFERYAIKRIYRNHESDVGYGITQKRTCANCGKEELRTVREYSV